MDKRMAHDIVLAMNSIKLVILLVLTFLKVGHGDAIQCFVCNSKSDPRCADPIETDWQGPDQDQDHDHESDDSNESNDSLFPVECRLAVQYSAGIQAVSDLLRGFGNARLGLPDLWISTSASLSSNSGPGFSGNPGGYNKGFGGKGYRGGSGTSPQNTYGGQRDQEDSMGCHKVIYTDSNGETVVDRGCAPARVANMEPCSALDLATNSDGNGNSGSTGKSASDSGYKNGFGSGYGGGGGGKRGSFDMTQISPDFCEVCNDEDACNRAANQNSANWIFVICILSILSGHVKSI